MKKDLLVTFAPLVIIFPITLDFQGILPGCCSVTFLASGELESSQYVPT